MSRSGGAQRAPLGRWGLVWEAVQLTLAKYRKEQELMEPRPTVFIVDDEPMVCESIAATLHNQGMATASFLSAEAFLQALPRDPAGCLVTDLRLPGIDGLGLQKELLARGVTLPVILLTAFADVPLAVQAMQSGVHSLLEKPYEEHALGEAIRAALELDERQRQERRADAESAERRAQLTHGEREVLRLLVEGHPNKAIAAELELGLRTVEKYRHNLLKKLGVDSLPELVRLVIQWGPAFQNRSPEE